MQQEEGKKYIISKELFSDVLKNIYDLATDNHVYEVMFEEKMHRTIFGTRQDTPGLPQTDIETNWIRIRVGDVNCDGSSQCTVTFKKKRHSQDKTDSSEFVSDDYYSVVQFFKELGFPLVSEQETLRSKYVFNYENVKYIICFDEWPYCDDRLFVTITASDNVSKAAFESVCRSLDLPQLAMQVGYVDIDRAYSEMTGKKASEIRQVRFNVPLRVVENL